MPQTPSFQSLRAAVLPLLVGVVSFAAIACSDHAAMSAGPLPTAPATLKGANPKALAAQLLALGQGLLREKPLSAPVTVTKVISNHGGTIGVSDADFELVIPAGAFTAPTMTISVTALAGNAVAYDFQPHGTVFLKPLTFRQDIGHTNFKGLKLRDGFISTVSGAYFADASQVDPTTGIATIDEFLPAELSLLNGRVTFDIIHFSGYMAAMGRQ